MISKNLINGLILFDGLRRNIPFRMTKINQVFEIGPDRIGGEENSQVGKRRAFYITITNNINQGDLSLNNVEGSKQNSLTINPTHRCYANPNKSDEDREKIREFRSDLFYNKI